jgi:hypothetical protein
LDLTGYAGFRTIIRQHNGSIFAEFQLEMGGYEGFAYWMVEVPRSISFDNCEAWQSRLQNWIRVTNVPAGFQASLTFSCTHRLGGLVGDGANTGQVEDWEPHVTGSGILRAFVSPVAIRTSIRSPGTTTKAFLEGRSHGS